MIFEGGNNVRHQVLLYLLFVDFLMVTVPLPSIIILLNRSGLYLLFPLVFKWLTYTLRWSIQWPVAQSWLVSWGACLFWSFESWMLPSGKHNCHLDNIRMQRPPEFMTWEWTFWYFEVSRGGGDEGDRYLSDLFFNVKDLITININYIFNNQIKSPL